jgi:hypothetical protein
MVTVLAAVEAGKMVRREVEPVEESSVSDDPKRIFEGRDIKYQWRTKLRNMATSTTASNTRQIVCSLKYAIAVPCVRRFSSSFDTNTTAFDTVHITNRISTIDRAARSDSSGYRSIMYGKMSVPNHPFTVNSGGAGTHTTPDGSIANTMRAWQNLSVVTLWKSMWIAKYLPASDAAPNTPPPPPHAVRGPMMSFPSTSARTTPSASAAFVTLKQHCGHAARHNSGRPPPVCADGSKRK